MPPSSVIVVLSRMASDLTWGRQNALLALKCTLAFTTIAAGHVGHQITRIFLRQLREAKRLSLQNFLCLPTTGECEGKKRRGGNLVQHRRRGFHGVPHNFHLRRGLSHDFAGLCYSPAAGSSFLRRTKTNLTGYLKNTRQLRRAPAVRKVERRRYWTRLDRCGPLYCQAVQKRLRLFKDDMLRYVTDLGKSIFNQLVRRAGCSLHLSDKSSAKSRFLAFMVWFLL